MREAASTIGVNRGLWSKWEAGTRKIPIGQVAAIEDALDVEPGSLMDVRWREAIESAASDAFWPRADEVIVPSTEAGCRVYRELWAGDWYEDHPPIPEEGG